MTKDIIAFNHFPDETPIKNIVSIPLLHILLGICNKTYSELVKCVPEADDWPKKLSLHREDYHGSVFEGNECRKLLKNIDILRQILDDSKKLAFGEPYVNVFEAFKKVLDDLYSPQIDIISLHSQIVKFADAWIASGMSVTSKVHIVVTHLLDFVILRGSKEIGRFCEQSHESAHAEFEKTWTKYKVKEVSNQHFKHSLLKSVNDYNAGHAV